MTLQVKNGQAFETDMTVIRTFTGRSEDAEEVTMRTLGGMSDTEDEINQLTWQVTLKPGETKEVKIRYTARVFTNK